MEKQKVLGFLLIVIAIGISFQAGRVIESVAKSVSRNGVEGLPNGIGSTLQSEIPQRSEIPLKSTSCSCDEVGETLKNSKAEGEPLFGPGEKQTMAIQDSSENILPSGFTKAKTKIDFSKRYEVCSVGAGLSGTVFAERTANILGKNVLVIDSRPHIGGNCYDFVDQSTGILRNQYGSHLFHTKVKRVWDYVTSNPNAPEWKVWYHWKFGVVNDTFVPIPVNIMTVNRLFSLNIKNESEMKKWLATVQIPCPDSKCRNAAEMARSRVGEKLYEAIFKTYTIKQWNKDPSEMNASVTARIPVRYNFDPRYFADRYQALPGKGYTAWFAAMLDHPLIDVVLNVDFFDVKERLEAICSKIVYTGPIDRYFENTQMDKLEYRSIIFTEFRYFNHPGYMLPSPVVNYPGPETKYTRAVEYKHYLHRPSNHTIVVKEESSANGDPYYPVPTKRNLMLYEKYKKLAGKLEATGRILFVGRLANYKYFNMDQAILNALELFDKHKNTISGKNEKSATERLDWMNMFQNNAFKTHKLDIEERMASLHRSSRRRGSKSCHIPLYTGEFGMELRFMVPWAYYRSRTCDIQTRGVKGTRYLYYFSSNHSIVRQSRAYADLPRDNPYVPSGNVHRSSFKRLDLYTPPPFKEFFYWKELAMKLKEKPLLVISNKYTKEWGHEPVNFFSVDMLRKLLSYLAPKYHIVYKRHTVTGLKDTHGEELLLGDKAMLRKEFPSVILFEDLLVNAQGIEEFNLVLFSIMSVSSRFLSVQGGTAVVSSYFGGTNLIFIKYGAELKYGDYTYFKYFSNATVVFKSDELSYLNAVSSTF